MALLDVLSFETGLISSTLANSEFDAVSVGASATFVQDSVSRSGSSLYALKAQTGASSVVAYGERDWGADQATVCQELYVRFASVPAAITYFSTLLDSTPAAICDLGVNASGNWIVYNYGNTTLYTSTGQALLANQWYRLELKITGHATTGTIDLKVNGVLEPGCSGLTGLNTRPGGLPRRYRVGVTVAQANAPARYIDDIIVATDWVGRGYVTKLLPRATDATAWTIVDSGKAGWATQCEIPWTSAGTDLIKSSTANQAESFLLNLFSQGSTGLAILGVQPVVRHKRTTAGSAAAVTAVVRSGSTDSAGASIDAGGTAWTTKRGELLTTDPATGAAWTLAAVNAMKLKLVHDAGTNECQVNASFVYVAYTVDGTGGVLAGEPLTGSKGAPQRFGQIVNYDVPGQRRTRGNRKHWGRP